MVLVEGIRWSLICIRVGRCRVNTTSVTFSVETLMFLIAEKIEFNCLLVFFLVRMKSLGVLILVFIFELILLSIGLTVVINFAIFIIKI